MFIDENGNPVELETIYVTEQDGHVIFPCLLDYPLTFYINPSTGAIAVDCPSVRVGDRDKAAISRVFLSKLAVQQLAQFLHRNEKTLDVQLEPEQLPKFQ